MSNNRDSVMKPDSSMERRRSLRILEKEIEKKKAKMDSTSSPEAVEQVIQNSPIFDPEMSHIMPNIINNLDPDSFVKLARTCKDMNHVCFNNNDRIKILCWKGVSGSGTVRVYPHATDDVLIKLRNYPADSDFVKSLSKMPFIYRVNVDIRKAVDERVLGELRRFFLSIARVVIGHLDIFQDVFDWEGIIEFIMDFHIDSVFSGPEIPLEFLRFFTQELTTFKCYFNVPDDVILRATTKYLCITKSRISKETFKKLIKKFVAGDIKDWLIGRDGRMDDESDPLFRAVSEIMETVEVEHIDRNAMEPWKAYFTPSTDFDKKQFYILKSDGSLASFSLTIFCVSFNSR